MTETEESEYGSDEGSGGRGAVCQSPRLPSIPTAACLEPPPAATPLQGAHEHEKMMAFLSRLWHYHLHDHVLVSQGPRTV